MKKTAQQLRDEAKKLMEQAKLLEEELATRIGWIVIGYAEKKWQGWDPETFRAEAEKILNRR